MIVDELVIHLKAGKGGDGCRATSRDSLYKPIAWGGDGGRGGSIFLKVSPHIYDISKFRRKKSFAAEDGKNGLSNNKTGKSGEDLVLYLPLGTQVKNPDQEIIVDMKQCDSIFEIVKGGRGGKGNYRRNYVTPPEPGEERDVVLDYRIPNDLALVGLPNSGKTTLFNILCDKSYKVADYPFTTKSCVWADYEYRFQKIIVLDLPALVKDADKGKGVGDNFLKHLYRTKAVLLISDNEKTFHKDIVLLKAQIGIFDKGLLNNKKFFSLLTKTDKIYKGKTKNSFRLDGKESCGIDRLKEVISAALDMRSSWK
ncbi:MAG: GTPase [Candidatus Omnitrophota bacterium]